MIACAAAGADVVDVAIDSQSSPLIGEGPENPDPENFFPSRHVWINLSTFDGCRLYGSGADHTRHGYPL
jgi:hypothetical protein